MTIEFDEEEQADLIACALERGTTVEDLIRTAVLDDIAR